MLQRDIEMDVPGGTMKAHWLEETKKKIEGCDAFSMQVAIELIAKPIKCIKLTGRAKDGNSETWNRVIYDKTLGESTLAQFMKRVDQKIIDEGLDKNYWITYKIPTEEEIEMYHPLKVWEKMIQK